MYKNNSKIVSSFIFLASQFRNLIELFGGQPQFPKGIKTAVPLSVLSAGEDKVVFVIGNSTALANMPVGDDDPMLGDRIKLDVYEDGTATVHTLTQRMDLLTDPLVRELSKTRLPHSIIERTEEPVKVWQGENAVYFSKGQEYYDKATYMQRQIAGGEFIIIYTKSDRNDHVEVKVIVDRGDEKSPEAIECFTNLIERFHRQPCRIFDHLIEKTASVTATAPATAEAKPTKKTSVKKPVTKTKVAKATKEVTVNEEIIDIPVTTPKKPAVKKKTAKAAATPKAEKPKGPTATRSRKTINEVNKERKINSPFAGLDQIVKGSAAPTTSH